MAKGRTKKQQEEMDKLSDFNNSQRFFWFNGKWHEKVGTFGVDKQPTTIDYYEVKDKDKIRKSMSYKEYREIISKFKNENKHLIF